MGSRVSAIGKVSGSPVLYWDHQKGPGGPPGGATYPGGPRGLKWEGNQPLVGWCTPPGPPSAPRVGNPRAPPLLTFPYIKEGGGRAAAPCVLVPPSPCYTSSSSRNSLANPCRSSAVSTTTPSCYWIFINLSFPLAGSRRRRRHADRTCVELGGAACSALGSPVIWITSSTTSSSPFFERFRA